ncbi:sigma-70 family RNA polymerase sigma factor [Streptomyces radicis]|uniref:sigma-70 family RNA polymerase sigma factor n=1 Tax=Streptomyces radicis TaxID=1750517 RepID=UPI0016019E21|nr:sigma-70 family RNA polymerase sigma factor [Streptomyces radicis]
MISLTEQQINDAKNNEIEAITAVIRATEDNVINLSRRYARTNGTRDDALSEELAQIGRVAVWEAIKRFQGSGVGSFISYIDRTVKGTLSDARKRETRRGVSRSVAADFERALRASGGDPFEAERVATDPEVMGDRRMSRETAYAARLSWQGADSLDAVVTDDADNETTLGEVLPGALPVPGDLTEPSDRETRHRRAVRERVHATLAQLGEQQRAVLKGTYGIAPMPYYGTQNDEELAQALGVPRARIRSIRARAHARFETLWLQGANADA